MRLKRHSKPFAEVIRTLGYVIFIILIAAHSLVAQPDNVFLRTYDGGSIFYDVYIDSDHNVILAGTSVFLNPEDNDNPYILYRIVKVNPEDGQPIWDQTYPQEGELLSRAKTKTVIQTDQGNYVFGGHWCNRGEGTLSSFTVAMITHDGRQVWISRYGVERTASSICNAVIETKGGSLLGCGRSDGMPFAAMITLDGNPIWERHYDANDIPGGRHFAGLREIEGGYLLAAFGGLGTVLIKIDEDGEILWTQNFDNGVPYALITCAGGGYATCGHCGGFREDISDFILMKFNEVGFRNWWNHYEGGTQSYCLIQDESGGYIIVGDTVPGHEGSIVRTDPAGNLIWARVDFPPDGRGVVEYYSIVTENGRDVFIAGTYGSDACLVKVHLESVLPEITDYNPESLNQTILLGDTLRFSVIAEPGLGEVMFYNWFMEDSLISTDTAKTVIFNELGDFTIKCIISNPTPSDSVLWNVHVHDLYIDSFCPDSLEIYIRRCNPVDFSVTPRAIEGDPINYLWTMTDLNTRRDTLLGETDSITVKFTKAHDFRVEGIAYRNQTEDAVQWLVHCCSTIWEWWPQELELSLPVDDAADFGIWPFNSESDSLSVEWSLDGEIISDNWEIRVILEDTGDHEITVVARDGCESDTLAWLVNVYDPDGIAGQTGMPILPEVLTLYPVYPNPFNAETSVRFYLPEAGNVRLQLYDLSGREVIPLVSGMCSSGFNVIHLNGSELPAGLYLMSLTSLDDTRRQKIVIVK